MSAESPLGTRSQNITASVAAAAGPFHATPSILAPASTPAYAIHNLSLFVLTIVRTR